MGLSLGSVGNGLKTPRNLSGARVRSEWAIVDRFERFPLLRSNSTNEVTQRCQAEPTIGSYCCWRGAWVRPESTARPYVILIVCRLIVSIAIK